MRELLSGSRLGTRRQVGGENELNQSHVLVSPQRGEDTEEEQEQTVPLKTSRFKGSSAG